jgi:hypothetical protein
MCAKGERYRATRRLDLLWFGVGDNPNFSVGLEDLHGFRSVLERMVDGSRRVHLHVLTNRRAMTAESLARLGDIALPVTLEEWSEAREEELLLNAHVAFLPVNMQHFSRAKSLNRAITALTAGCQVLSAGFPLYQGLHEFVYRDAGRLLADLDAANEKLRPQTLNRLLQVLSVIADIETEAGGFLRFLEGLVAPFMVANRSTAIIAIVHGWETADFVHKFAHRRGLLSVSSPFTRQNLNFDFRFALVPEKDTLELLVSRKRRNLLGPQFRKRLVPYGRILTTDYEKFSLPESSDVLRSMRALVTGTPPQSLLACYLRVMDLCLLELKRLCPDIRCVVSEHSRELPLLSEQLFLPTGSAA